MRSRKFVVDASGQADDVTVVKTNVFVKTDELENYCYIPDCLDTVETGDKTLLVLPVTMFRMSFDNIYELIEADLYHN